MTVAQIDYILSSKGKGSGSWVDLSDDFDLIAIYSDNIIPLDSRNLILYFDDANEVMYIKRLDRRTIKRIESPEPLQAGWIGLNKDNMTFHIKQEDGGWDVPIIGKVHDVIRYMAIASFLRTREQFKKKG